MGLNYPTVKYEGANNSWRATSKAFGEQILMGVLGKADSFVLGPHMRNGSVPSCSAGPGVKSR